jgi:Uma2 family endonuclease
LKSRIEELGAQKRRSFWRLCPDFVIELRSATDRLKPLQNKMLEYLEQGAQLGWLIDVENKSVEIYRPGQSPEKQTTVNQVAGEGPVSGFILDLTYVWDPLAG